MFINTTNDVALLALASVPRKNAVAGQQVDLSRTVCAACARNEAAIAQDPRGLQVCASRGNVTGCAAWRGPPLGCWRTRDKTPHIGSEADTRAAGGRLSVCNSMVEQTSGRDWPLGVSSENKAR